MKCEIVQDKREVFPSTPIHPSSFQRRVVLQENKSWGKVKARPWTSGHAKALEDDEVEAKPCSPRSLLREVHLDVAITHVGGTLQCFPHDHRLHLQSTPVAVTSFLMFISLNAGKWARKVLSSVLTDGVTSFRSHNTLVAESGLEPRTVHHWGSCSTLGCLSVRLFVASACFAGSVLLWPSPLLYAVPSSQDALPSCFAAGGCLVW